nr:phospholipid scramblase 2-like isoform X1 [Odocoileus virginianus texanus]
MEELELEQAEAEPPLCSGPSPPFAAVGFALVLPEQKSCRSSFQLALFSLTSPEHSGCPTLQAGNSETHAENHVQDSNPETQAEYPSPQPAYPETQIGYLVVQAGKTGCGLVDIPVQYQQVSLQPNIPAKPLYIIKLVPSPDCPPGLQYLSQVNQILIHQQIELTEGMYSLY